MQRIIKSLNTKTLKKLHIFFTNEIKGVKGYELKLYS